MNLKELSTGRQDILKIDPSMIEEEDGFNVRSDYGDLEELAYSIAEHGVKRPINVYVKGNRCFVKDGHRRLRAVKLLRENGIEIKTVPVIAQSKETEEQRVLDLFVFNDGKPLLKLEQGSAFLRLINFGWKQTDIAKKVSRSGTYVGQCVALARTPRRIQQLIVDGLINDSLVLDAIRKANGDDLEAVYTTLLETVEEIHDGDVPSEENGNIPVEPVRKAKKAAVVRKTREKLGKTTVSQRFTSLNSWIEESEESYTGDDRFNSILRMVDFLQGKIELSEIRAMFGEDVD